MGLGQNLIPYQLPSQTYSATSKTAQALNILPKQMFGRNCHLVKVLFAIALTPTYTTAPTVVGHNSVFTACQFWDGSMTRFAGGFNHLRAFERLHNGKVRLPDADTDVASGTARYFRRMLYAGPPNYQGSPNDFAIPVGMLENGELRFTHGALTDISADTTAATGTIRVVAWLALLDEIRIPPAFEVGYMEAGVKDNNLPGRALYDSIAVGNSTSFDAITAGDFGNFRVNMGFGEIVPTVDAGDLTAAYHDDYAIGDGLGAVTGEPDAATDDNVKTINRGTPTQIVGQSADLQPVLWSPPNARISKLPMTESGVRFAWDGTQSTGLILYSRILPQPQTVVAANVIRAIGKLGVKPIGSPKIKTLSKKEYRGPYAEFMPWTVKVG